MSYTQWILRGKLADGRLLPNTLTDPLLESLFNIADKWHTSAPEGETLCAFMTNYSSAYDAVVNAVGDFSESIPNAVFFLECRNTDEAWYQRIYFRRDEREAVNGYIAYDEPIKIRYDSAPHSSWESYLQYLRAWADSHGHPGLEGCNPSAYEDFQAGIRF